MYSPKDEVKLRSASKDLLDVPGMEIKQKGASAMTPSLTDSDQFMRPLMRKVDDDLYSKQTNPIKKKNVAPTDAAQPGSQATTKATSSVPPNEILKTLTDNLDWVGQKPTLAL